MEKTTIKTKRTEFYEDEKLVRVEEETVEERTVTPQPTYYPNTFPNILYTGAKSVQQGDVIGWSGSSAGQHQH